MREKDQEEERVISQHQHKWGEYFLSAARAAGAARWEQFSYKHKKQNNTTRRENHRSIAIWGTCPQKWLSKEQCTLIC